MADVADILGLKPKREDNAELLSITQNRSKRPQKSKGGKPAGVSREVFNLLGDDGIAPMVIRCMTAAAWITSKKHDEMLLCVLCMLDGVFADAACSATDGTQGEESRSVCTMVCLLFAAVVALLRDELVICM
jgi:hypothetical protein